jgi:hypothetical protein
MCCNIFPIRKGLKREDSLLSLPSNFASEYADDDNLLGEDINAKGNHRLHG